MPKKQQEEGIVEDKKEDKKAGIVLKKSHQMPLHSLRLAQIITLLWWTQVVALVLSPRRSASNFTLSG